MTTWFALELDEDPATLHAALAMIDSLDDGVGSAEDSSLAASIKTTAVGIADDAPREEERDPFSDDAATDQVSVSVDDSDGPEHSNLLEMALHQVEQTPRKRIATAVNGPKGKRMTPRHEILKLRDNVTMLEKSLATLKRRRMDATVNGAESGEDLTLAIVWEELAMRQYRQRQSAERENKRLREVLGTQITVGQQLIQLMRNSQMNPNTTALSSMARAPLDASQLMTEEQMVAKLDDLFVESESVFSTPRFHNGPLSFHDIKISDAGPVCTQIDSQVSWSVPFGVKTVRHVLWDMTIATRDGECPMKNANIEVSEEVAIIAFGLASTSCGEPVPSDLHGKLFMKRFAQGEARNAMIVTSLYAELTVSLGPNTHELVTVSDEAWMRVRKPSSTASEDDPLCVVQSTNRIRLVFRSARSCEQRRQLAAGVVKGVIDEMKSALRWKQQVIEDMLLYPQPQERGAM